MTHTSEASIWNRLTVGQKLAAIPVLFAIAILGILAYTLLTAQDQQLDAFLIDMSARQRMLVQRQLAQTLMIMQGATPPAPIESPTADHYINCMRNTDYLTCRRLMKDSLESLINGGGIIDLSSGLSRQVPDAPTPEIRAKMLEQKSTLAILFAAGDRLMKLKTSDSQYADALDDMFDKTNDANAVTTACVKLYASYSQSKISSMIFWETIISIVVIVLAALISWYITQGIVSPLSKVVDLAKEISNGNLRANKLTETSRDELGQLATVFNQMLDSLRELSGQTASVTNNLNAAAAEILASTQQQAAGTKEQAATIQQITTTMEEVRQSGMQISDKAKQVATAAEASSTITAAGLHAVQETNRTMEAIREQVEEVAEKIVALSEKTQAVGEIIATVNDIAERSNLLALNAAIEAAGAGEQGNRFSVVANEIKNLADQAKESTVQVRGILGDIQKGINSSVMLTEEAVKRSDAGKQQSDATEQTIRRMADTTQESVQAFQQIIGATSQQQIGFEQVTQGMQDIRQAASQTAASTVQLEKAVANLNTQSNQLRDAVGRYQL